MSTAPATAAGAAAPDAGAAPPKKIETVPADIRRRVLGMKAEPPLTPEEIEAKKKADKDAADKKLADEKAAADKKKTDDDAAAAAKTDAGAAVDKVKKVKAGPPLPEARQPATDQQAVKDAVRQLLPEITRENAPAAPAVDPEVQREIDMAKFAEAKHGDKYAGFAEKVAGFYSSRDQLLVEKAKELGGSKSADFRDWLEGDEFKGWVEQNRPSYARGDKAKLQEEMIAERARDDAKRELAPQLKALERQTAELKHAPEIKARTNAALKIIITDPSAQKDPALEGFEKDPVKFGEQHPEEARIIASEAAAGVELIEEVYRIDRDLVDVDPKNPTPRQAEIRKFMQGQNASLRKSYPNGIEMTDGTILIDADTFNAKGLTNDPRYRVFNADEIAGMLAATRNAMVLDRLKNRREGIAKSVYAKPAETPVTPPPAQTAAKVTAPPAPAAGSSAAPGTALKIKEQKTLGRKYA